VGHAGLSGSGADVATHTEPGALTNLHGRTGNSHNMLETLQRGIINPSWVRVTGVPH
jgi:hypothetical protein